MVVFQNTRSGQTLDIQVYTDTDNDSIIDQIVHRFGDLYETYKPVAGRNIDLEVISILEFWGGGEFWSTPERERDQITKDLNDQVQELIDYVEQDGDQNEE